MKGERIECNCSTYEKNKVKDQIYSGLIWIAWIVGILYLCVKCCSDMI